MGGQQDKGCDQGPARPQPTTAGWAWEGTGGSNGGFQETAAAGSQKACCGQRPSGF